MIVRLNVDGSKDVTFKFKTGFNNTVECLALQADNKVLAGGYFTNFDNKVGSTRITRLRSSITGIDEKEIGVSISIFPNPSHGLLNVQSSEAIDVAQITDIEGREIKILKPKMLNFSIDFSTQAPGVYFLRTSHSNQDKITKIVIN
jgi:hypothetical protein